MNGGGVSLSSAARALGGDVSGGGVVCPGPSHSRKDRSLSVRFGEHLPGGFTVFSHAGDDFTACRDHVRERLGWEAFKPGERREVRPAPARPDEPDAAEIERTARALALWNDAQPLAGTPGAAYLARRGVPYDGEELRWHPRCPFGEGERHPCMLSLLRDVRSDEPRAVHRTAFTAAGEKFDRKVLGPARGAAIKLFPDTDSGLSALGVGEGIETSLSIRRLSGLEALPVWSLVTAGGIAAFPVLPALESLWIAVDRDPAGEKACRELAERAVAAGREAFTIRPRANGSDLNDLPEVRHG